MSIIESETDRLLLRQWRQSDKEPFAALNADPRVMEYFHSVLSKPQSDAMADRCSALIAERGWGFWAVESKASKNFLGFVGLHIPSDELPFSPCVEIGWRLAYEHWGKGYATESAKRSLLFAFTDLNLDEVVSFTSVPNHRSRAVMERIGMTNSGQDFEHPDIPKNHPLSEHVLYKLTKARLEENGL